MAKTEGVYLEGFTPMHDQFFNSNCKHYSKLVHIKTV